MKRKKTLIFLIVLLILGSISMAAPVDIVEPNSDFYILDKSGVLSQEAKNYIIDINQKLNQASGSQVVIVIIPNLSGLDINFYATSLFENWGIGSKELDNGILYLISLEDREVWIETGYGLEGAFPDTVQKRIIDNYMLPFFSKDNYEEGIVNAFNKTVSLIEEEYGINIDSLENSVPTNSSYEEANIWKLVLFIIVFLLIDSIFFKGSILRFISRQPYYRSGPYRGGYFGSGSSGNMTPRNKGGGGRSGGGGAGGKW